MARVCRGHGVFLNQQSENFGKFWFVGLVNPSVQIQKSHDNQIHIHQIGIGVDDEFCQKTRPC